jgi:hypothetical protein
MRRLEAVRGPCKFAAMTPCMTTFTSSFQPPLQHAMEARHGGGHICRCRNDRQVSPVRTP